MRDLDVLEPKWSALDLRESLCFNPCEGFGCFGTALDYGVYGPIEVSIPVRDLDVLEPSWSNRSRPSV